MDEISRAQRRNRAEGGAAANAGQLSPDVPRWFLDVDGVLSPFGVSETWEGQTLYPGQIGDLTVPYRQEVVDAIARLHHHRVVEMCWLTTWDVELLQAWEEVGLGPFRYGARVDGRRRWWKANVVEHWLAEKPRRRAVWTDDDLTPGRLRGFDRDRLLAFAPDHRVGLTLRDARTPDRMDLRDPHHALLRPRGHPAHVPRRRTGRPGNPRRQAASDHLGWSSLSWIQFAAEKVLFCEFTADEDLGWRLTAEERATLTKHGHLHGFLRTLLDHWKAKGTEPSFSASALYHLSRAALDGMTGDAFTALAEKIEGETGARNLQVAMDRVIKNSRATPPGRVTPDEVAEPDDAPDGERATSGEDHEAVPEPGDAPASDAEGSTGDAKSE